MYLTSLYTRTLAAALARRKTRTPTIQAPSSAGSQEKVGIPGKPGHPPFRRRHRPEARKRWVSRHSWPWERRDLSAENAESAERTKKVGYILLFAPPTPARSAVYTNKQGVVHRVPIKKMVGVQIISQAVPRSSCPRQGWQQVERGGGQAVIGQKPGKGGCPGIA